MCLRPSVFDRPDRAQSEVVGVALLTGVVVVVALTVGAVVIAGSGPGDAAPTTDFRVEATATDVLLTHNGGEVLEVSSLTVILEQPGSREEFTPAAGDTADGDGSLEPGDRIRRVHGLTTGDLTVTVVHRPSNEVLFEDRTSIPP